MTDLELIKSDEKSIVLIGGKNGAGKTTTIRMILGILKKDSGEITWKGKEVSRKSVNFGYLPEERGVYPKTKIMDQLMYFAELKGMKKENQIFPEELDKSKTQIFRYIRN